PCAPHDDLTDGQPVTDREAFQTHEREKPGLLQSALDGHAAERIGTIEDDDSNAGVSACASHEHGRPDEGVVPRADILKIDDDDVDSIEVLGSRRKILVALTVEADDAHALGATFAICNADHVLGRPCPTVLGAENDARHDAELAERDERMVEM